MTTGKFGNAMSFDGVNDYLYWGYNKPANDFTIAFWFKAVDMHEIDAESAYSTDGITGQKYAVWPNHEGDYDGGAGVSIGTNGISVYEHGSNYMPAIAVYSASIGTNWNYLAVVYKNKQPKIYLNGVLVRTGLQSTRRNVYAPTQIGGGAYGYFNGVVDEFRVYSRALSPEEVAASYDATVNRLYHNFTNLPDGLYGYSAYIMDASGNLNKTSLRTVVVGTMLDGTPPIISIALPLNKTYNYNLSLPLNYAAADNVAIDAVKYSLDDKANITLLCNKKIATSIYDFKDTTNNNAFYTVYTSNPPTTIGGSQYPASNYTAVSTNDGMRNAWSSVDFGGGFMYVNLFYNFTINESLQSINQINLTWIGYNTITTSNGNLSIYIWDFKNARWVLFASDIASRTSDRTYLYSINSSFANFMEKKNLIIAVAGGYYNRFDGFMDTLYENYVSVKVSYQASTDCKNATFNASEGWHKIFLYANDTSGNNASSSVRFGIDLTKPTVSVQSPVNSTYPSSIVALNYAVSSDRDACRYELDGKPNTTIPSCINTSLTGLAEDHHNIVVWVNDTAGNIASSSRVYFTVFATAPQVTIQSPINKTYSLSVPLRYTVSSNRDSCKYELDGINTTVASCSNQTLSPSIGNHSILVWANSTEGKWNSSKKVYFTISSTPFFTKLELSGRIRANNATRDLCISYTVSATFSGASNSTATGSDGRFALQIFPQSSFGPGLYSVAIKISGHGKTSSIMKSVIIT
ncbi:MAG: LamG domain-containing protein [Candidatus Aenigmarchaeota archaeon]|nr:LamG domain-containing protein [Candidatus Aenigmarchaeota archaeon]